MKRSKSRSILVLTFFIGCSAIMALGEQNALHAQSVVGVWECPAVATPWGPAHGKTILMPDGTFTKTVTCGEMHTWDKGTYTVGKGFIHYKILDHEPKRYKGKKMHWLEEETSYFQFEGPDRIVSKPGPDGTRVVCFRVR